jgi:hypothetical protein
MLRAVKSGAFTSKAGERTTITAGVTGVAPSHWLAREYPEAFRVCDGRDTRSLQEHSRSLEHVRQQLERGRTPAGGPGLPRSGVLPSRPAGPQTWRLPRPSATTRPLRLPR